MCGSHCLSEFLELSLSNYLGLVQTYALAYAYAYVLGRGRTPDVFFFRFCRSGPTMPTRHVGLTVTAGIGTHFKPVLLFKPKYRLASPRKIYIFIF